jgi:hypothetical protein
MANERRLTFLTILELKKSGSHIFVHPETARCTKQHKMDTMRNNSSAFASVRYLENSRTRDKKGVSDVYSRNFHFLHKVYSKYFSF